MRGCYIISDYLLSEDEFHSLKSIYSETLWVMYFKTFLKGFTFTVWIIISRNGFYQKLKSNNIRLYLGILKKCA